MTFGRNTELLVRGGGLVVNKKRNHENSGTPKIRLVDNHHTTVSLETNFKSKKLTIPLSQIMHLTERCNRNLQRNRSKPNQTIPSKILLKDLGMRG